MRSRSLTVDVTFPHTDQKVGHIVDAKHASSGPKLVCMDYNGRAWSWALDLAALILQVATARLAWYFCFHDIEMKS